MALHPTISLQDSPYKFTHTKKDNTKVKKLYYIYFRFPHLSKWECKVRDKLLASSSFGDFPEVCKPKTCPRPFASYSSKQTQELDARKNK